jgi:hypothetical protein
MKAHRKQIYSLDYFIEFYRNLDPEEFCNRVESNTNGRMDAWDFLLPDEQDQLYAFIRPYGLLIHVNDGIGGYESLGKTHKERVLNFLLHVKAGRVCTL